MNGILTAEGAESAEKQTIEFISASSAFSAVKSSLRSYQ